MNSPRMPPAMLKARPTTPPNGRAGEPEDVLDRLSSTNASNADTVARKPKTSRAQPPTDIGDQYFTLTSWSPGVTSISMCQNLGQPAPRSAVSSTGQTSSVIKLA